MLPAKGWGHSWLPKGKGPAEGSPRKEGKSPSPLSPSPLPRLPPEAARSCRGLWHPGLMGWLDVAPAGVAQGLLTSSEE